jgi:hypothetical protein
MRLVDTVEVGVIPVLLGEGVPLLPAPAKRVILKLSGHKLYAKTGIMSLEYAVQYGHGSKRRRGLWTRAGRKRHPERKEGMSRPEFLTFPLREPTTHVKVRIVFCHISFAHRRLTRVDQLPGNLSASGLPLVWKPASPRPS